MHRARAQPLAGFSRTSASLSVGVLPRSTAGRGCAALALPSAHALRLALRTFSARPTLGRHVRSLALYSTRVSFDVACTLAQILAPHEGLTHLQVRFPASDLPLALDFLEALNPSHFEWITSPTWMIRPGKLFQRFLSKWTRLRRLRLGNFFIDSVLAESIAALTQITHLTLLGASNKNLDTDSVRTLLDGIPKLTRLEVGDCPLRRRVIIEAGLGAVLPAQSEEHTTTEVSIEPPQPRIDLADTLGYAPRSGSSDSLATDDVPSLSSSPSTSSTSSHSSLAASTFDRREGTFSKSIDTEDSWRHRRIHVLRWVS